MFKLEIDEDDPFYEAPSLEVSQPPPRPSISELKQRITEMNARPHTFEANEMDLAEPAKAGAYDDCDEDLDFGGKNKKSSPVKSPAQASLTKASPEKPIFLRDEAEIKIPAKPSPAKHPSPSTSAQKPLWLQAEEPQSKVSQTAEAPAAPPKLSEPLS